MFVDLTPGSGDGGEVFDVAFEHVLVQAADRILGEVRRRAMSLRGGFITILLVDDDRIMIALDDMRDVLTQPGSWREAGSVREGPAGSLHDHRDERSDVR